MNIDAFRQVWLEGGGDFPYAIRGRDFIRDDIHRAERTQAIREMTEADARADQANDDLIRRAVLAALEKSDVVGDTEGAWIPGDDERAAVNATLADMATGALFSTFHEAIRALITAARAWRKEADK